MTSRLHDELDALERSLANGAAPQADGDVDLERDAIQLEPESDWPAPDLPGIVRLPSFPVDALPIHLRNWAVAESTFTQTPVDLSAVLALAATSLACARKYHVQIRPGWTEPTNLWLVVALPPGERKSPPFVAATAPIYAWSRFHSDKLAPEIARRASERRVLQGQIKDAESKAIAGKPGVNPLDLIERLEGLPEIHPPVLLTDDCTPEALAVILSRHGERMGIFSDEGGPFEMMAGRYSDKGSNFEIYLKSHPGSPHVVHRISRDPVSLANPLLTMGLAVQPTVIQGLAARDGFRGKGLLARFLYSLPTTALGERQTDAPEVPTDVSSMYKATLVNVLERSATQTLALSSEADAARSAYQRRIEPRLGIDGDLHPIGDWAGKLVGTLARLAAVLHVGDHALTLDGVATLPAVPAATWVRAEALGEYFLAHALQAFGAMGTDPTTDLAMRIWSWVVRHGKRELTQREAMRAVTAPREDTLLAIAQLVERSLIRERQSDERGPGRPRGPLYEVSPRGVV